MKVPEPSQSLSGLPGNNIPTQAPLSAFGGGAGLDQVVGQAQQLGDTTNAILRHERDSLDDAAVQKASGDLIRAKMQLTLDPVVGFQTKRGEDAAHSFGDYQKQFADAATSISGRLGNSRQQEMFGRVVQGQGIDFETNLRSHVASEAEKYKVNSANYTIKSLGDDIASSWNDPAKVASSTKMQLAAFQSIADGMPKSEFDDKVLGIKSSNNVAIIENQISQNLGPTANTWLEAHKSEMTESDYVKMHDRIEKELFDGRVDKVYETNRGHLDALGNPDLATLEASVRKEFATDPKQEYQALSRVRAMANQDRAINAQEGANRLTELQSRLQTRDQMSTQSGFLVSPIASDQYGRDQARKLARNPQELEKFRMIAQGWDARLKSDPAELYRLRDGIYNGTTTEDDITKSVNQGTLSSRDMLNLLGNLRSFVAKGGMSPEMKGARQQAKDMILQAFPGTGPEQRIQRDQAMNTLMESKAFQDANADEVVKTATEMFKGDRSKWRLLNPANYGGPKNITGAAPTYKYVPNQRIGTVIPADLAAYKPDLVSQAQAYLTKNNRQTVTENVKYVLDHPEKYGIK